MRKADDEEITQAMTSGIVFKGAKLKTKPTEEKVKTKAKKKTYITGLKMFLPSKMERTTNNMTPAMYLFMVPEAS